MSETSTAPTSTTTRAAVADRFGGPEVVRLADVPRPRPAPGEVLVRMRAASVTVADHRIRARDVPRGMRLATIPFLGWRRPRHPVLGVDGAGVVEALGDGVTDLGVGDEVLVVRDLAMGCHAELVTVRANHAVRKPAALSFVEGAALLFGGMTALSFLAHVDLREGTRVLVNGASGAVGTAVVQLAAAAGAHVTGVCSGANADLVRGLGAARVVDYGTTDFAREDERYDVVVECVGNAPYARVAPVLRRGGTLLMVVGDLAGMATAAWHSRRLGGLVTFRGAGPGVPERLRRLVALAEQGVLRPVVDRTFAFDDVVAAHRYVDTGRKRGNVLLVLP
ncbi:zinc-binding dehydrogenase [Cellulomonas sp. JZ18]|uniref:NAD(P)-dependent alcohol dehydrogenase n=1 Tax=Cellulomonas sp. JZ18 TaxID=2654191 RepID=UPI0012D464C2|nr:NAD(P)-dependent alcohol dehydrogenase [Cellulomonas sp. JZ18]QGQ19849.1 zinc-binding dehydrogenase [Cellulomonas sp. JZ18]